MNPVDFVDKVLAVGLFILAVSTLLLTLAMLLLVWGAIR